MDSSTTAHLRIHKQISKEKNWLLMIENFAKMKFDILSKHYEIYLRSKKSIQFLDQIIISRLATKI